MEMSLSQPIAEGRTAEVYAWDDSHILKLYRDWCPAHWVENEARVARAIVEGGIPSPAPGDIVEVNGGRGLIYERLVGISMLQDLNTGPWTLLRNAQSLAELHAKIHRLSIEGLPSYKARLRHSIVTTSHLPDDIRAKSLLVLDTLPDGRNVCHGDYHPGNVFITGADPLSSTGRQRA